MAASLFDSPVFTHLFPTGDTGRLFSDSAELRAILLVEGALAEVQGKLGVIPDLSAAAIHRAAHEIIIDPASLAEATGSNGVMIPALLSAFRAEMQAPEHAQFVHWGATSQDIIDTALMLRLRQVLALSGTGLGTLLDKLATLADTHSELAMPGRTWGQHATPVSFGAMAANWGAPLFALQRERDSLTETALWVSLSGAAGSGAALGPKAAQTRAALAAALGLSDPGRSWHTDRTPVLRLADWLTRLTLALSKIAEDVNLLSMSGIAELRLGPAGSSSTMPQKQNPVQPGAISALARMVSGHNATLQASGAHRLERDGPAWFTEWMTLPQLCLGANCALTIANRLLDGLHPDADAMERALAADQGQIHAEALSFRLAAHMRRPDAQAATKALCLQAAETGESLYSLAARAHPDVALGDVFDARRQLGEGPQQARDFARAVQQQKR